MSKSLNKKTNKKTIKKQKFKTFVIPLIVFIVIITIIVAVCVKFFHKGNNSNNETQTTININDYTSTGEYLKINATDCTLYVGSMVKLTCSSYPDSYAMGVKWSSSDTSVITITYDGMVTAMKSGIAAITATNGVLTNSIIIQVVEEDETPEDDLPMYDPNLFESATDNNPNGNGETPGVTLPNQETSQAPSQGTNEEPTVVPTIPTPTEPVATEPVTTAPIENTQENTQEGTQENTQEPTTEDITNTEESTVDTREVILYTLPEFGFSGYNDMGDTFVFKEDGNYLGQVIVGTEFTQIYVMTRTTGFDRNIKGFLEVIFPKGHATVFNKFVNAASDTTFYVDGYKVRAITSPSGGHRQLIIYY